MAGLPSSIMKRHPGNLKAAWAEFRGKKKGKKAKASGSKPRAKKKRKTKKVKASSAVPAAKRTTKKKSGGIVSKRKKSSGKRRAKARRVASAVVSSRPVRMVGDLVAIGGGAVATSMAVNKLPFIRDQNGTVKALTQAGFGALLLWFFQRQPLVQKAGGGAIVAAFLSTIRNTTGIDPLAGSGRRLSPEEVARLRKALGAPVQYGRSLGAPVQYQRNLGALAPDVPALNTGWEPGW